MAESMVDGRARLVSQPPEPDFAAPCRALAALRHVRTDPATVKWIITAARFWFQVEIVEGDPPEAHWLWHGPTQLDTEKNTRYAVFRDSSGKGTWGAARMAWMLTNGEWIRNRRIEQVCDEPLCVKPFASHWELNHVVLAAPGSVGMRVPWDPDRSDNPERDAAIHALYAAGGVTMQVIADAYRMSRQRVHQIIERQERGKRADGIPR